MPAESSLNAVATRIESLIDEIGALANPRARDAGEQLVELLMRFYGGGLARVLEIVDEEPPDDARRMFEKFARDELVASLLVLHDLHPVNLQTRVESALGHLEPRLDTPGDLTLVAVKDGVARVRVAPHENAKSNGNGNGNGAGHGHGHADSAAMRRSVEQAVIAAAPEIVRVEVEGLEEPPPALIQLSRVRA